MRELRVSRSSSDCMEGSGARQASDVKPRLKSYITKVEVRVRVTLTRRHRRVGNERKAGNVSVHVTQGGELPSHSEGHG